ncbi:asparagine synthase (glutamine-hydrolyzing) [Streptomyces caelestis]|jgi:asparagine synthase (glutamine-hydrolysing)|uniref:asparagine synthase (glutamine-hydrolyzing) n=1 Tax=Streptomyces caelestis TaxID=36816 RepID=A0A7W9GZL3_9ACTN|nr:asparagine synthase (glutamine-hydrolyzing) [Streptomyces caelestis]MBB5792937.1 asparagine synthase (glutamine-hydrolyzing) [Streptomyces caelestis]
MCGLAAVARLDGQNLGPEADVLLKDLADILRHRGPDEQEMLRNGPVGLAFTRLSLVDPTGGSQPLVSDDGNLVLIANGEVYNHKELAARLPSDVKLKTGSDCEVLLYLYRQHGLDFLRDVRGMFAVILWDRTKGQLVLARDRFGIKPLYFHRNNERIVLSSEIKGLFADPQTPRRFAWEEALAVPALAAAPRFSAPQMCTWFEGVESVPAATILRIDLHGGRTTRHRYWEMPVAADESATVESFTERYSDLLRESVKECATADTELGLFLSGGIDSSSVLALALSQVDEIHTFTVLAGGTRVNGDVEHSYGLARELGVHNHQVVFPPDHVPTPEEWTRLLWLTETPMTGPEVYYKHELHRFARAERPELRGMLLGAASDEFNGGYSDEFGGDWDTFLANLAGMDRETLLDQRSVLRHWWPGGASFLSDQVLGDLRDRAGTDAYRAYLESEYRKVQQYNVWHEDRTAAGSGIEARVPFLDHRLVELTAAIPERLRPRLLWDKRILRDAMRSVLPQRIAERPKGPFFYGSGTNHAYRMLVQLMRSNDQELVERALAAPGADTYLNGQAIRQQLAGLGNGDTDSASVELLMRVVNMGLLAEMVAQPPCLEEMSAGSRRSALQAGQDPVATTEELFAPDRAYDPGLVPVPAEEVLLLTDGEGMWYLTDRGQIEFVLEQETPILSVLRLMDGRSTLAEILGKAGLALDDVRSELDTLFEHQLLCSAK